MAKLNSARSSARCGTWSCVGVFPNAFPTGIAVTGDGAFAYVNVTNQDGPDTTLVIDTSTNTVVATVVVGDEPQGVAIATITSSP